MEKGALDLSIKENADRIRNKTVMISATIMNLMLTAAYYLEAVKGNRSYGSFGLIAVFCLLPCVLSVLIYRLRGDSVLIRYIFTVCFCVSYGYIMFTSVSWMPFCYVVVMLTIFIAYVDLRLCAALGVYSIVINAALLYVRYTTTGLESIDIVNGEVMLACLILTTLFSINSTRRVTVLNQAVVDKVDQEKEKTERVLKTTMEVADSINQNIERANRETQQLDQAIHTTQASMERLSDGAQETARAMEDQQGSTRIIEQHINSVTGAADRIMKEIDSAQSSLEQSGQVMESLLEQVTVSQSSGKLVAENMEHLKQCADRMEQIVALIRSISSQTTLLSFNATIEAARAGAAGKGFAVVAGQVSELAKQTDAATLDIQDLIENVASSIAQVTDAANVLLESNQQQNVHISRTAENFKQIQTSTDAVAQQADRLQQAVEGAANANMEMVASIGSVAEVTQGVSASAEETLVNCNQNRGNIQALASVMEHLSQEAARLTGQETE